MSPGKAIRFGVFEVDPQSGELRKLGVRIRLQDQPFKILIALLERPGEAVTRDELRQRIWGNDTFVDFDHGLSAAVNRLREALGDSAENPRYVETLARRGYRFIGQVEGAPEPAASKAAPARRPYWIYACAAASLLVVGGFGIWTAGKRAAPPAPHVVPLTTLPGSEGSAAFSPDGKQVAFAWNGEKQDNVDVYVKVVGDTALLRLTSDPAVDTLPSWSPDGRQIAFVSHRGGGGIYVISPLGGSSERKLTDLPSASRLSWTTDGKYLLVAKQHREERPEPDDGALFLVPVDGKSSPQQSLKPPKGTWYLHPAMAPNGRSVAVFSCTGAQVAPTCSIQVFGASEGWIFSNQPRQISQPFSYASGLTWAADGNSVIYGGAGLDNSAWLWRVQMRDDAKPERLDLAGNGVRNPSIDFRGNRLAFSRTLRQPDIWRLQVNAKPSPFLTSSLRDVSPQYSTDGSRIVFESERGGHNMAIWIANADGTGLRQITKLDSPHSGTPRWSPDGRRVAFDSMREGGGWDVWTVEENGANPRQLTHGPADNAIPSWSRDGSSIYFASNRSGRFEIWRVSAQGGTAEQITRKGGYTAFESADGKTLYYTLSNAGTEGLHGKRLPDGEERQVLEERVVWRAFTVVPEGVYYIHGRQGNSYEIRFCEFADGRSRILQEIEGPLYFGLTVSPDRKTFLYSKVIDEGSDLVLIENFR